MGFLIGDGCNQPPIYAILFRGPLDNLLISGKSSPDPLVEFLQIKSVKDFHVAIIATVNVVKGTISLYFLKKGIYCPQESLVSLFYCPA